VNGQTQIWFSLKSWNFGSIPCCIWVKYIGAAPYANIRLRPIWSPRTSLGRSNTSYDFLLLAIGT